MKLDVWLKTKQMTIPEFAEKIGKDKSLVHRYIYEGVKPKDGAMLKIFFETLGAVNANDFYGLSEKVLEEHLTKDKFAMKELHVDSFK